jgi:predicted Zn-dependent protease
MAEFQARHNEKDAALRLYALAVLVGRQIARYWLYRAQWETICGDPEQVDGYLTEGLNHCPDDIDLLRRMAEEKDRQGDMPAAITLLERAVDLKPNWPDLRYDLARLYERNEKTEESLNQFGKALEINPNYEDAALSHAEALMKRGQVEEAEEQLLDIQRREIKSQRVYQMLSQIYAERGDRRQAEHFSVLGAESDSDGP